MERFRPAARPTRSCTLPGRASTLPGRAITLVELLVASVILVVIITPICMLFSTSSKTIANARNLTLATSLAGSYLSALDRVPIADEFGPVTDTEAPAAYIPEALGVPDAGEEFTRSVTIVKLDDNGSGKAVYRVCVTVEWEGTDKSKIRRYALDTIVAGDGS